MGQTVKFGLLLSLFFTGEAFQICKTFVNDRACLNDLTTLYQKKNRQGDLLKKLEVAKEQARQRQLLGRDEPGGDKDKTIYQLTDEEIKIRNDRKRFEELLKSEAATSYDMETTSVYKTIQQEEEEMNAGFLRLDRLFEGDPAPATPFEDLVNIKTEKALGKTGIPNILPWLHKNALKQKDFVVLITDPRDKSLELRATMKSFFTGLAPHIQSRIVIVNADSPVENRKWLKKQGIESMEIFSDEKREFMRQYTALGEKRWAMCLFILSEQRVQRLVRELDMNSACLVVNNAIQSLSK